MYLLERACTMQVRTLSSAAASGRQHPPGRAVRSLEKNVMIGADGGGGGGHFLVWPALIRRLDRVAPRLQRVSASAHPPHSASSARSREARSAAKAQVTPS
jgi:hypothetical protein